MSFSVQCVENRESGSCAPLVPKVARCGAIARSSGLYFNVAIRGIDAQQIGRLRYMAHARDARTPWEIRIGALVLPRSRRRGIAPNSNWFTVTIYTETPTSGHSTPIAMCTFPGIDTIECGVQSTPFFAPVVRTGDDYFETIGQAVIACEPEKAVPQPPSWLRAYASRSVTARIHFLSFSAAPLPILLRSMSTAPVAYYGGVDEKLMVDVVVPVLAPFMASEDESRARPTSARLWLALLRYVVRRQNPNVTPSVYVASSPHTIHRQLLEDLLAVVALRGEFYPDQLWGVQDKERRMDCDFYTNLLCHPDPTAAAGDCEDRAMAILTVFDALTRVEVEVDDQDPDAQVLRDIIRFARRFEACAVDAVVHDANDRTQLQKHMIVWLVPREMLDAWASRGSGDAIRSDTTVDRSTDTWMPAMPILVETAAEIVYDSNSHRSVLPAPAPVVQETVAGIMTISHCMYITLYCIADARSARGTASGRAVVVRDLYANCDASCAGMEVPTAADLAGAWARVCTRARVVEVSHDHLDLAPIAEFSDETLAKFVARADQV